MARSWPISSDYAAAVQTPDVCCSDPDLQSARAATSALGLPRSCSGTFGDVYQFQSPDGKRQWAVKCFTKSVAKLNERYDQISQELARARLPFAVEFKYLPRGILVRGEWYPVLKMDWVDGLTLRQFMVENLQKPRTLKVLLEVWLKVLPRLREAGIAHGDLQHGNVMLVPGSSEGKLKLQLIDYDGMWVPSMSGQSPTEVGHSNYQHPQRAKRQSFTADVDRFPHLVIACALDCLGRKEGPALWKKFDNADNLLFRQSDFESPAKSPLLRELWETGDPELQAWVARLAIAAQAPLEETPDTDQLCFDGRIQPVTGDVEHRARQVLGISPKRKKSRPAWMIEDAETNTAAPVTEARFLVDGEGTITDRDDDDVFDDDDDVFVADDDVFDEDEWLSQSLEDAKEIKRQRDLLIDKRPPRIPPERLLTYFYFVWWTLGLTAVSILQSFMVGSPVPFTFVAGIGSLANLCTGFWLRRLNRDDLPYLASEVDDPFARMRQPVSTTLIAFGGGLLLLTSSVAYWHSTRPVEQSLTVEGIPSPISNQDSTGKSTSGTNFVPPKQSTANPPQF